MAFLRLIPVGRAYASEERAKEAAEALLAKGFDEDSVSLITPSMIESAKARRLEEEGPREARDSTELLAELVIDVHDASRVPDEHAWVYADNLEKGRSLVLVTAPFGSAQLADDTLGGVEHVELGTLPVPEHDTWNQAAPLSAWLRLPVLKKNEPAPLSNKYGAPVLTDNDYLPTRGFLGGLLTENPTPLSSKLGMKAVGENEPAPLSRAIGMPVLKEEQEPAPLSRRLGLPVLKENEPAPLSRKLGLSVLTKERPADEKYSFGLPMLLRNNPAPLSSLLGLPVIKSRSGGRRRDESA